MRQIQTGHKAFDRAANGQSGYVGKGNVISLNQYSCHVRAWNDTECNGFTFAPGHLQTADLGIIRENYPGAYRQVEAFVKKPDSHFRNNAGWVYVVRHFANRKPVLHGVLVTSLDNKRLAVFSRGQVSADRREMQKSQGVMEAMTALLAA